MSRIILAVAMLALHTPIFVNTPVNTSTSDHQPVLSWESINMPSEGLVIDPGSDVLQLLADCGSRLFSVVQNSGCNLYCSGDGGYHWEQLATLEDGFVELVEQPGKADILYYATSSTVFRSDDGGRSFSVTPRLPGVDGVDCHITAISAAVIEGQEMLAVAVASSHPKGGGGVYLLRPTEWLARWHDSGLANFDACDIAFIPGGNDELVLATIGTQTGEIILKTMVGNSGWGSIWNDGIFPQGSEASQELKGASLALPDNFDPHCPVILAGLESDGGGVYQVELAVNPSETVVYRLTGDTGMAVTSLDAGNDGVILAGTAGTGGPCFSDDRGVTWTWPAKPPTGDSVTSVLLVPEGWYMSASGKESAVSFSRDGVCWHQLAFVDTRIDSLLDFAISPEFSRDSTLYLLTWGGSSSLWYSADGGSRWTRYLNSTVADGIFSKIGLSPEFGSESKEVFLAGEGLDGFLVWRSVDGGRNYTARKCPLKIDCWEITGDGELLAGGFDGIHGVILRSKNGGFTYMQTEIGSAPVHSLEALPDESSGSQVLAGDIAGNIYFSRDSGASFCQLPGTEELSGAVSVAFDTAFSENNRIFAASDLPGEGIASGRIAEETDWIRLETGEEPAAFRIGGLAVSDSGLVYAADLQPLNLETGRGSAIRVLEPARSSEVVEVFTKGLQEGCSLRKLVSSGNVLWAMDINHNRLLRYVDTLVEPPELIMPADGAEGIGIAGASYASEITLEWAGLPGAARYRWQVSEVSSFAGIDENMEGVTTGTRVTLPLLEAEHSYFWRVRVAGPVSSPWAKAKQFETALATSVVAPQLKKPLPGEKDIIVNPLFQWEKIEGAEYYELVVSADPGFEEVEITCTGQQSLAANAWQADEELEYSTGYFWRVRAVDAGGASDWSDVGSFITVDEPVLSQPPLTGSPVTTVTTPVTTVVTLPVTTGAGIGDITVVVPTLEVPGQTTVVTQAPGISHSPVIIQMPEWGYVVIVMLGLVLFVLLVLLAVVIMKKPPGR